MARRMDREREARILALVDQLIEAAMGLGLLEGEARAAQWEKGRGLVKEVAGLAVDFLEGRSDLLENLLEQLAAQRLPDREILKGFGSFGADLKEIIREGVARYREQVTKQEAPPQEGQVPPLLPGPEVEVRGVAPAEHRPLPAADAVLRALALVFPGREVQQGYPFHGTTLAYYLPQEKVAVAVEGKFGGGKARQEYYCRLEGINLIILDAASAANPWRAAQVIRQARRRNNRRSG
ncbi:MAG: hypothetical protein H5U00_07990 [Clostridia bacterium]|nr:hypothetical protein [Clostridia bacterium]